MSIPIVGQPHLILWSPLAVIVCPCQGHRVAVLQLVGFGNRTTCGQCHKSYYVKGITPDGMGLVIDYDLPIAGSAQPM